MFRGSIASIVRIAFTAGLIDRSPKFWIKIQPLSIVVTIELGLGIIAASLATMRPLLRKFLQVVRTYKSKISYSISWSRSTRGENSQTDHIKHPKGSGMKPYWHETGDTFTSNTTDRNDQNFLLTATNVQSNFLISSSNADDTLRSFDEKEFWTMKSDPSKPVWREPESVQPSSNNVQLLPTLDRSR